MGLMAILNNFTRIFKDGVNYVDATIDPGGIPLKTSENFSAAGDDSHPLPGDFVAALEVQRSGGAIVVGYNDPKNAGVTKPGGKRIYSRNEDGEIQGELWLKNDSTNILSNGIVSLTQTAEGTQIVTNGAGTFTLEAGGDIVINGVRFKPDGTVTGMKKLELNEKEIDGHLHNAGNPPGTTGANI